MLIIVNRQLHLPAELSLLSALDKNDCVLCCSGGIYSMTAIQQAMPNLSVYALNSDMNARGVTLSPSVSVSDWVTLQSKHQQWITI